MNKKISAFLICCTFFSCAFGEEFKVSSPDRKIQAVISVDTGIRYSLFYKDKNYLLPSSISMTLSDGKILGLTPIVMKRTARSVSNVLKPLYDSLIIFTYPTEFYNPVGRTLFLFAFA